ncbi:MAG TPA: hypothetical protein VFZ80_06345, partial [Acidimicrobiia bacterium]
SAGTRVLLGRSWESGGAPPYWPWVQAIRGYLRVAEPALLESQLAGRATELVAMLPELDELIPAPSPVSLGEAASERFRLFDAASTFLINVASSEPVVIVLEDLQAADVPSLLLLDFLSNHIAEAAILIVATYRDVELSPDHPLTPILGQLHRLPATSELALRGLDPAEVALYLEAAAGRHAASTLSTALYGRTSGNPLFLSEAVRLMTMGASDVSLASLQRVAIPAEIRAVIQRRLDGLSTSCKELLVTLSVLGDEFDVEMAAKFADLQVDEMLERIGEALTAGLVIDSRGGPGTFAFAHDLVRQALYASLPPATRVRLHRSAAAVLEMSDGGADSENLAELALHYFEAAAGGEHVKAVEYGRLAGEQAIRRLAYEEAVRLFEMAVQTLESSEVSDPQTLGSLLLSLGDARVRAGDLERAGKAFLRAAHEARRSGDARLMARAAVGYGGRFVWARAGSDSEMVPLLQDALVMLGGEDDKLRVRLLSRLACATRSVGDREHGAALARQGVALAREIGDPETLIYALSGLAGAIWWPENPKERIDLGTEMISVGESAGIVDGEIDGHMTLCSAYAELGDFAAAREELRLLSRAGGSLRLDTQRWLEGAMSGVFALSDGGFARAETLIDEMLHKAAVTPARDNIAAASFQLFLLRREQARLPEIEPSVRLAAEEFTWYPIHQLALAELLRLTGRLGEARSMLSELGAGGFARFHRDNYWIPSMCLASELVTGLGEVDLARVLMDVLAPFSHLNAIGFPEGSLGAVARYVALLATLLGDHEVALATFDEAVAANERNGALPWLAHTYYDKAKTLIDRGSPDDLVTAQGLLADSLELCEEVGLVALGESVRVAMSPDARSGPVEATANGRDVFRREGDYFSISFRGDVFRLKDAKGLRYLSSLLAAPGREIHVLDLVAGERGVEPTRRGMVSDLDGLHDGGNAAPVLDRVARQAYESRLIEIEDDIDEATRFGDQERVANAMFEREFLVNELAGAIGIGGRDRAAASDAERARINVTRAIRAAVAKVDSNSRALGAHLDATVRTGVFCSYNPDPLQTVTWYT